MLNELKLITIIEEVCHNSKKYNRKGTFDEVAIVLEKEGKKAIEGMFYYHSVFTPFLQWLETQKNKELTMNLKEVRKLYLSEEEAIKNLPILYSEYIKSL